MMRNKNARNGLRFEQLEGKRPLAADVGSVFAAEIVDGDLVITNSMPGVNESGDGFTLAQGLTVFSGEAPGDIFVGAGVGSSIIDPESDELIDTGGALQLAGFTGDVLVDFGSTPEDAAPDEVATFSLLVSIIDAPGDIRVTSAADGLSVDVRSVDLELFGFFNIAGDLDVSVESGFLNLDLLQTNVGGDLIVDGSLAEFGNVDIFGLPIEDLSIGGALSVTYSEGDNSFEGENFAVGESVDLSFGDGSDSVSITNGQITSNLLDSDFSLSSGSGDDEIEIDGFTTGDDFLFTLGDGSNSLFTTELSAPDDLRVTTSSLGESAVGFFGAAISDDVVLDLNGSGDVALVVESTIESDLAIQTTGDFAEVEIEVTTIGGDLVADLGDGDDFLVATDSEIVGDATVYSGDGSNAFLLDVTTIGGRVFAVGGADKDEFVLLEAVVQGDVLLSGRGGNDTLAIDGALSLDDIRLIGGDGDDTLSLTNGPADAPVAADDVVLISGNGADTIVAENVAVGDDVLIRTSGGDDTINFFAVDIGDDFLAFTGSGNDTATFEQVTNNSLFRLFTQSGDDSVSIIDSDLDFVHVGLGSGDDDLTLGGLNIDGFAFFDGGSGYDTITDLGDNDFESARLVLGRAFEEYLGPDDIA